MAGRTRWAAKLAVTATTITTLLTATPGAASASTMFSDDFESADLAGWKVTGDGTWTVIPDGTLALNQTAGSGQNARVVTGLPTWTSYTVEARVKPITFAVDSHIALLARSGGPTRFYRLALMPGNVIALHAVNGTAVTVLDNATYPIDTLTWYRLSLEVTGTTVRGAIDGNTVVSATSTLSASGQIGLQTTFATASFDDVVVHSP